ncbi:hypothetical protein GIB67_009710 [Kingdonia uniflora]|uniref:Uncharacterized protein n=1 Tax=Kingdonia uniflora TaxID=39325 RepID=A0A7J7LB73_9MAGN|nr:hypothetical protein GIB67_009710 [Kingdonia uniflora]
MHELTPKILLVQQVISSTDNFPSQQATSSSQREHVLNKYKDDQDVRSASDMVFWSEGLLHVSKLKCRLEALPAIRGTNQLGSKFRVFVIHFLNKDKRLR